MATPGALASIDDSALIEQVANGVLVQQIAEQLGVHHSSLYRRLVKHPDYPAAQEARHALALDDAQHDLITADERTLPRAREVWRAVTWRAEREAAHRWGQRTQVDVTVDIGAALQDLSERLRVASEQRTVEGVRITDVMSNADSCANETDAADNQP